jgi:DNA (cytosine-5)-methyltransferase 1
LDLYIRQRHLRAYVENFGADHFNLGDIADIGVEQLPGVADLAWASFPCQDISLAGERAGLDGARSSTFWSFWSLVKALRRDGRAPRTIVLENVCGLLTAGGGKAFASICSAFAAEGYLFGVLVIDAALFIPQSRPRLFFVAAVQSPISHELLAVEPDSQWHPPALTRALSGASARDPEDLVR